MDHQDELSASDYRALAEFRFQLRRFLRFSEKAARRANVEPQQYRALLALKGLPDDLKPTVGALAERLQIAHHSAVELADRLVQHGLLERTRDTADRRQVFLSLTPEGAALLRELAVDHRTELRSIGPALVTALEALLSDASSGGAPPSS